MAGKRVTDEDILKMNMIYYECHNKAETARQVGFSASTVAKYLIPNFTPIDEESFKNEVEEKDILFNPEIFRLSCWNDLISLTEQEKEEMELLRKEVLI